MKRVDAGILGLGIASSVLMVMISLGRLYAFSSNAWDLAIFTQFSWLLSGGLWHTNSSLTSWTPLADHASFLLIPLSFIYRLLPGASTLLILQAIALAMAPWLLISLRPDILNYKKSRYLLVVSYFLQPMVWNASWFDFHPDSFFPVLSVCLSTLMSRGLVVPSLIIGLLTLSVRETSIFLVLGLSISHFLLGGRRLAALVFFEALLWILFLGLIWIPSNFPEGHHNTSYYSYLSVAFGELLNTLNLDSFLTTLVSTSNILLLPRFLFIVGFTWFAWLRINSLPWLFGACIPLIPLVLSSNSNQLSTDYHYALAVLPFFLLAAADNLDLIVRSYTRIQLQWLTSALFTASALILLCNLTFQPGWLLSYRYLPKSLSFAQYLSRLPKNYTVLASNGISSLLADRPALYFTGSADSYRFPKGFDYLLLNMTDPGFASSPKSNDILIEKAIHSDWKCREILVAHLNFKECKR